jgi:hypothetical protein
MKSARVELISLQEAYNMIQSGSPSSSQPWSTDIWLGRCKPQQNFIIACVESPCGLDLEGMLNGVCELQRLDGSISNIDLSGFDLLLNVDEIYNSQIKQLRGSSQIGKLHGSSRVKRMLDSSQIGKMHDSSRIIEMYDSSQIEQMYDLSQIGIMLGSSQIEQMYDSSQVEKMLGSSQIGEMSGSSQVKEMYDKSRILNKL